MGVKGRRERGVEVNGSKRKRRKEGRSWRIWELKERKRMAEE